AEIDREILAYPYPGKSANNNRGNRAVGESDKAKKLIARVRPGEAETFAAFSPTKPLMRLDLPTLDRPRKANSGAVLGGNCSGANADNRNFVNTTERAADRPERAGASLQPKPPESPHAIPATDLQARSSAPRPSDPR